MSGSHSDGLSAAISLTAEPPLIRRATADGILTFVNDAYCASLGLSRYELLGRSFWTFIPGHEHVRVLRYFADLTPLESVGSIAHLVHTDAGYERIHRWIDFGRFDAQGHAIEWLSTGEEVAASPKTAAKVGSADEISHHVHQDLEVLGPIAPLGVLAGSLAHELDQPLTIIARNTEAVLQALDSKRPDIDEARDLLQDIVDDSRHACALTRQFVATHRQGPTRPRFVDVNAVAANVVRQLMRRESTTPINIELQLTPGLPVVLGDPNQIHQVILNLLANACESVAASDLPSPRRHVVVRTERRIGELCVSVIDRGRGITSGEVERIFEPFYTTQGQGMGLGLALCHTIVALHQGRMHVEQNENGGATFSFTLRIADVAARAATTSR